MPTGLSRFALLPWMLVLAVIPAGIYLLHVYDQVEQVRAINLRTLAKAARATGEILENSVGTVRNLSQNLTYACEFVRRQPRLKLNDDCAKIKPPAGAGKRSATEPATATATLGIDPTSKVQIELRDVGLSDVVKQPVVFEVNLDTILGDIPFGSAVDLVLIIDKDGNVLRQHQPAGRRTVGVVLDNVKQLAVYDEAKGLQVAELSSASSIHKVKLAGADYDLLCQPLPLDFKDSTTHNWTICGLMASERTLRTALEVAPLLAILLFSMVVFGVLTWPI